jgi:cytidine deaminase
MHVSPVTFTFDEEALVQAAITAAQRAYVPYSNYQVGAALLSESGQIYLGCNVENAAYPECICAERTAVVKAVSEGERRFQAIAVATQNIGQPCGACRQVLREFAPKLVVILADFAGNRRYTTLAALLPDSFGPEKLD